MPAIYPKSVPPRIAILGVPSAFSADIAKVFSITTDYKAFTTAAEVEALDLVLPSSGVIFHMTDDPVAHIEYIGYCRTHMGNSTPFTLITPTVLLDDVKNQFLQIKVTRFVANPDPKAFDFAAEALYLIATHKFEH